MSSNDPESGLGHTRDSFRLVRDWLAAGFGLFRVAAADIPILLLKLKFPSLSSANLPAFSSQDRIEGFVNERLDAPHPNRR